MGCEQACVDLVVLDQAQQGGRRIGVDQTRCDRYITDPQILEMQSHRLAMHADIGDISTGTDQAGGQLEGVWHPDCLNRHIRAKTVGQLEDSLHGVLSRVVDHNVGAEALGSVETSICDVDRHDVGRAVQTSAEYRREADRACPDYRHHITRLDTPVENSDLVAGRQDIGEHQDIFIADGRRNLVCRGVGERNPDELGLGPVDLVAQDPAASAYALPVASFSAVAARATGRNA